LSGMDSHTEAAFLRALEQRRIIRVAEVRATCAGDVDADDPAVTVFQGFVHDDLVLLIGELAVEAEDEAGADRILQVHAVEAADGGHHDVVQVLLAAAVPFHRIEAHLERGDVVLAVGPADDLVHRRLDGDRAGLDQLGPVIEGQELVEALPLAGGDGDEIDELPVVLGRKPDPLLMRDRPHDRRIDGAAEVGVEIDELVAGALRHPRRRLAAPSLLRAWAAGAPDGGGVAVACVPRGVRPTATGHRRQAKPGLAPGPRPRAGEAPAPRRRAPYRARARGRSRTANRPYASRARPSCPRHWRSRPSASARRACTREAIR